jgi:hypothetical protein
MVEARRVGYKTRGGLEKAREKFVGSVKKLELPSAKKQRIARICDLSSKIKKDMASKQKIPEKQKKTEELYHQGFRNIIENHLKEKKMERKKAGNVWFEFIGLTVALSNLPEKKRREAVQKLKKDLD